MPIHIDVAPIMDRVSAGLQWLLMKQMYVWKTEYTIEKLKKSRDELKFTIQDVQESVADAQRNGWLPKHRAEGWMELGYEIMGHADKTVAKFDEQLAILNDPDSVGVVHTVFHCPCDVLSRRVLNAEAITRFIDIKEHIDVGEKIYLAGGFEAVAVKRSLPVEVPGPCAASPSPVQSLKTPLLKSQPSLNDQHKAMIASGLDIDKLKMGAVAQYRALARSQSHEIPVMIRVRAPRYARWSRAPIDLVVVLDVSSRLEHVKQGAMFVVHNLEAEDRLSILQSFQTRTHLLFPLTHMSDQQKTIAKSKIKSLSIIDHAPSIDFVPVMETAYQILKGRLDDKHRASSILLLTDGLSENRSLMSTRPGRSNYPTYTIGIGSDHDPRIMYELATRGQYGTYSLVDGQDSKGISNAMALCIGGLTSIVAQQVNISMTAAQEDVKISRIVSGAYGHVLNEGKLSGSITVDDLYGLEEKNFLVYVKIPVAQGMLRRTTKLLTVKANYYCHVTKADVKTDPVLVSVKRPVKVRGQPIRNVFPQVTSEVMRVTVLERVKEISIRSRNEEHDQEIMSNIVSEELKSIQDYIGDTTEEGKDKWDEISMDLDDMQGEAGLAYMLSWLRSHQLQRAATTPGSNSTTSFSFRTTRMHNMTDSVDSALI